MKKFALLCALGLLAGCQHSPGEVTNKVLQDFGLKARPEGYVSTTDRVREKLTAVGQTEMKRMNAEERNGEVKFQEQGAGGQYYKEVKIYEKAYPLDARSMSGTGPRNEGPVYSGYVEYSYQVYQSARKSTRVQAEAESATIPTGITGRETYRYNFDGTGNWDGGKGEKSRS